MASFVSPLSSYTHLYPSLDDFMKVLQDEGIVDKNSKQSTLKYNVIEKFSTSLFKNLKLINLPGLTPSFNQTRGKSMICSQILYLRKHVDKSSVFEELRNFGKNDSTKVYIITNDVQSCAGFDVLLKNIESTFLHLVCSADNHRTPNDALRVCGILLLPKYRGTVDGILNKKRQDRAKADQAVDVETAFYEEAVGDFNDASVVIAQPFKNIALTDYEKLDPNDMSRIEIKRDSKWFKDCWEIYFKSNYRKYLRKWNKDTGGGGGLSERFEDFCENQKWVCWVFLLDEENNFLLASTSSGNTPRHLSNESGFSSSDNKQTNGDEISFIKSSHGKLLKNADDNNRNIKSLVDNAQDVIAGLNEIVTKVSNKQGLDDTPKAHAYKQYARITSNQNMISNDIFCSPEKKKRLLDSLKKEKSKYIEIIEAVSPVPAVGEIIGDHNTTPSTNKNASKRKRNSAPTRKTPDRIAKHTNRPPDKSPETEDNGSSSGSYSDNYESIFTP